VVDVWRADLGEARSDGLLDMLCAQERARAARIVGERNRALWARSRTILRVLLGRYVDRDPSELRFELGPHGKPALRDSTGQASDLRFNLSHSDELMLVAVTAGREVGVDVERARERCTTEFLRTWTMREATVKCLGTGLASAPLAGQEDPTIGLWTAELDLGPRAAAAVAVRGEEACELRCWETAPTLTLWPL
jgi:4'-phosphopantetheinyl transferase